MLMKGKIVKTSECKMGVVYIRYQIQVPRKLLKDAGLFCGPVEISATKGNIIIAET